MLYFCTLPWYCKGFVIMYDIFRCLVLHQHGVDTPFLAEIRPGAVASVFGLQTMCGLVLLAPSLCLSVSDRLQTNSFISEILLLLSVYAFLITCMRTGMLSTEQVCFSLQFCSSYFFYCFFHACSHNRRLMLGNVVVKWSSLACMVIFPVLYSHLLQDCLHLSPYVLMFVFAGEASGCVCACVTRLLCFFEFLIYMMPGRLADL